MSVRLHWTLTGSTVYLSVSGLRRLVEEAESRLAGVTRDGEKHNQPVAGLSQSQVVTIRHSNPFHAIAFEHTESNNEEQRLSRYRARSPHLRAVNALWLHQLGGRDWLSERRQRQQHCQQQQQDAFISLSVGFAASPLQWASLSSRLPAHSCASEAAPPPLGTSKLAS